MVGFCVSIAAAVSIAQVPVLPLPKGWLTTTTGVLAPLLWLIACAVIIVSYMRRPASEAQPALPEDRQPLHDEGGG